MKVNYKIKDIPKEERPRERLLNNGVSKLSNIELLSIILKTGTKNRSVSNLAIDVLNKEGAIGIFPEGTRNKTNEFLLPFKYGSVSMAKKTNATIIPVGITGKYKRKEKLVVRFGTPFKVDEMSIEDANKKLYNEISNLMKENIKLIEK